MLLIAMRHSKIRLLRAIVNRKKQKPQREIILQFLRIFAVFKEIPKRRLRNKRFSIDAVPKPFSKAFAVVKEFNEAGIQTNKIHTPSKNKQLIVVGPRVVFYFIMTLPVLFRLLKPKTKLDLVNKNVVFGYAAYKCFLKRNKIIMPIIISDITPHSHILWAAAVALNREALWWQDDYHHYNGFSECTRIFKYKMN
jgi:hypothetical protein